uniref:YcfA family protein n=1 Tax=Cyanothece sp. (strain PCC 7425 / ATCC 29141) TaxID=395961 RepID=B8HMY2_CYAP4
MPKKIRELKAILLKAGFTSKSGKGSHSKWEHPSLKQPIIIARKDGADAPLYLEKQINEALEELRRIQDDTD